MCERIVFAYKFTLGARERAQHIDIFLQVQIVLNEVTEDADIERNEKKMSIRDMNFVLFFPVLVLTKTLARRE